MSESSCIAPPVATSPSALTSGASEDLASVRADPPALSLNRSLSEGSPSILVRSDGRSPQAATAAWLAEALSLVMPEEYPGQHMHMADQISTGSGIQASVMVRMFLISNNLSLQTSRERPVDHRDDHISAIVESLTEVGARGLEEFLRIHSPVYDALRSRLLWWAIRFGHDEIVSVILRQGFDFQGEMYKPYQSIAFAAELRDKRMSLRMVNLLLKHGATVDGKDEYVLSGALGAGNEEVVHELISAGVSQSALKSPRCLLNAVRSGNLELVYLVLETGVDINIRDPWSVPSFPALMYAAFYGLLPIARALVERGADVNAVHAWTGFPDECTWLRTTALGIAIAAEQVETAQFLATEANANMDLLGVSEDPNYVCPLCIACFIGSPEIITFLLDAGADVMHSDNAVAALSVHGKLMALQRDIAIIRNPSATKGYHRTEKERRGLRSQSLLELVINFFDADLEEEKLVELCESLIVKGARIDRALVMAVEVEKIQVVKLLIERGASLEPPSDAESSAFGLAIATGNLTFARILYEAGATRTGRLQYIKGASMAEFLDRMGLLQDILIHYGPLLLAAAIANGQEARWLLDRIMGSNISLKSDNSGTVATAETCARSLKFFAEPTHWGVGGLIEALEAAVIVDSLEIIQLLLSETKRFTEGTARLKDVLGPVLRSVASRGSSQALRTVISRIDGYEANCLGEHLTSAILHGNYRVVRDMIDAGAAVNHHGPCGSPLCAAVQKFSFPHVQVPVFLRDLGGDESLCPRIGIFPREPVRVIEMLLDAGADITLSLSANRRTALEEAVSCGNMKMVDFLLSKGVNPNLPSAPARRTMTALQEASNRGYLKIARKLIEAGADINAPGTLSIICPENESLYTWEKESTCLAFASAEGRLEILHLLLSRGAGIYGPARTHYITAVMMAAYHGHNSVVQLLRSHGGWTESDEREAEARNAAITQRDSLQWGLDDYLDSETVGLTDTLTDSSSSRGYGEETQEMDPGVSDIHTTEKQDLQGHADVDQSLGTGAEFDSFFYEALGEWEDEWEKMG